MILGFCEGLGLTSSIQGGEAAQALQERLVGSCGHAEARPSFRSNKRLIFPLPFLISYIITGLSRFFLAATRQDVIKPPRSRFGLRVLSPLRHRERGDEPSAGLAAFPGRPYSRECLPHGCSTRGPGQVSELGEEGEVRSLTPRLVLDSAVFVCSALRSLTCCEGAVRSLP